MNIEERIEYLVKVQESHDAEITRLVEATASLERSSASLERSSANHDAAIDSLRLLVTQVVQSVDRLARVALVREQRLDDIEEGRA